MEDPNAKKHKIDSERRVIESQEDEENNNVRQGWRKGEEVIQSFPIYLVLGYVPRPPVDA